MARSLRYAIATPVIMGDKGLAMADFRAISAVCESVIKVLESNSGALEGIANNLGFKVFSSADFVAPIQAGVSLFLYRIEPNGNYRSPQGRSRTDGTRQKPQLSLDLHFFLTAWGKEASLQNTIAGWMMRTLEDYPILSQSVLNSTWSDVFLADETVELALAQMKTEELFNIWEQLVKNSFQLSVPYVARVVKLESFLHEEPQRPVRSRQYIYHLPSGSDLPFADPHLPFQAS